MKKIITPLLIVSLLIPQFSLAKNSDLVNVEYVKQAQTTKKGLPFIIAFIRIGFRVYRVLSRVNNVRKLVKKVKHYVDQKPKINQAQVAYHFSGDMKISLIDSFYATSSNYKRFEPILFKAKLKEKSYTYLISLSNTQSCLLYPNGIEHKNYYQSNRYYTFGDKNYKFYSDSRGEESFYLVSSTKPLLRSLKSTFTSRNSIFSCGGNYQGARKLKELRGIGGVEVRGVRVFVD